MSLTVTLPDEIAAVVEQVASARGVSTEQVIVDALDSLRPEPRRRKGLTPEARARVVASMERHDDILERLA